MTKVDAVALVMLDLSNPVFQENLFSLPKPERFDTECQIFMAKQAASRENISYDEVRAKQVESIASKRLGDPKEFGATCAFLCSHFGGFISGQNFHLDGGSYPALIGVSVSNNNG